MNITIRMTRVGFEMLKELQKKGKRYKKRLQEKARPEINSDYKGVVSWVDAQTTKDMPPKVRDANLFPSNRIESLGKRRKSWRIFLGLVLVNAADRK